MQYKLRYNDGTKRRLLQQADFMRRCDEIVERARAMNEHIAEHLPNSTQRQGTSNRQNNREKRDG